MSSVDGEPARLKLPLAMAVPEARPVRDGGDAPPPPAATEAVTEAASPQGPPRAGPDASAAGRPPVPGGAAREREAQSVDAAGTPPGGGLAALLEQARAAQAQLAHQPLPITNHNSRLIMKLFGG